MSHTAEPESVADDDQLAEQFFSQPPQAWEVALDDWQPRPLSTAERRAMHATFSLVGGGALAAFALLLFSDSLLSAPAPLSAARERPLAALSAATPATVTAAEPITAPKPVVAPEPDPIAEPEPVAAVAPAPVALTAAPSLPLRGPRRALDRPQRGDRTAVDAVLSQARRALNAGDPRRARELASRAISLAPTRAAAYIVLAGALDALGDRAGMRTTFRSCVQHARDALASACETLAR
jgi:hypothetical protein